MASESVLRGRGGFVSVDHVVVAPRFNSSFAVEVVVHAVRDRTPDAWWMLAAEIQEAELVSNTPGPLGLGVDFFADDMWLAVPPEVRDQIQDEAYEVARAVIVNALEAHAHKVRAALAGAQSTDPERDE